MRNKLCLLAVLHPFVLCGSLDCGSIASGQEVDEGATEPKPSSELVDIPIVETDLKPLTKDRTLHIDTKRKVVVVEGEVCLREGQLEMFACPKGSKEHESLVAVYCKPQYVHAALLAVGAKKGHPVQFVPKYKPASGTRIDIDILWQDKEGEKHRVRAQEWIKHVKTGKPMPYHWVFAGSGEEIDQHTRKRYYWADGGDFICVSNFSTATLDLPVESSQTDTALLFSANTERIPPVGTKVRMVLIPRHNEKEKKPRVVDEAS
jgi:hypothetical protein